LDETFCKTIIVALTISFTPTLIAAALIEPISVPATCAADLPPPPITTVAKVITSQQKRLTTISIILKISAGWQGFLLKLFLAIIVDYALCQQGIWHATRA